MSKFPVNIFLPAAGLGERLRPITNHLPKPLLPMLGKPIIAGTLEKLTSVCSGEIGINLHYKSELIRNWVKNSPYAERVTFFPEDPILGTGGALKNAERLLQRAPFIVHNADILLAIDFERLVEEHLSSGNIATLACHDIPELANVVVDENMQVIDVENPGASKPDPTTVADKVAYTGIAIYSPEILRFLPEGVSHTTVAWIAASKAGHKVRAMDFTGAAWNDVGTPATYTRALLDALREQGETVYFSPSAKCGSINIDGLVIVEEKSTVVDGANLRNCIVMPGASVSGTHENRIIGPDYSIALPEADMQPSFHLAEKKRISFSDPLFTKYFTSPADAKAPGELWTDAILIGLGGSDRRYFRVKNNGNRAVLMECKENDPDYERHIIYTDFFSNHGVPVPALLSTDNEHKRALFEDLGDTSLYSYMKLPHTYAHITEIYQRVLDILVKLHANVTANVHECPQLQNRIFDYDYLRWETRYFVEQFVSGFKKVSVIHERVDGELSELAKFVDSCPKHVIHRDFQCQNIMITKDNVARVIDFQGARMAPPAYDIASMLWDPYHRLGASVKDKLLRYYIDEMKKTAEPFDETAFLKSLIPCRLQRHMQALGAYAFLAEKKGKKYFLKHVPEALRMLKEEAAEVKNEFPELYKLVSNL